eukprot:scaffold642287_cov28-Prasinocladus_malaysianus.AAC.1
MEAIRHPTARPTSPAWQERQTLSTRKSIVQGDSDIQNVLNTTIRFSTTTTITTSSSRSRTSLT